MCEPETSRVAEPLSMFLPPLQLVGLVLTVCLTSNSNGTAVSSCTVLRRVIPPPGKQSGSGLLKLGGPELHIFSCTSLIKTDLPVHAWPPGSGCVVTVKNKICPATRLGKF